jgi:hypothetical protein
MARLKPDTPDNTRTCPFLSGDLHPDRHGHMPLGMSRCLVSGQPASPTAGGQKFLEDNPMNRDLSRRVAQTRCGARTRGGRPCRCPAMPNGTCRIHGGLSPGAPRGAANGRFRDGYWTREAVQERELIRRLLKDALNPDAES